MRRSDDVRRGRPVLALLAAVAATGAALPAAASGLDVPAADPAAKLSETVGRTEVALEYTRPAVRSRKIWGALVPYGQPWSISPQGAPVIRFGGDVLVGDRKVAAGRYQMTMIPSGPPSKRDAAPWIVVLAALPAPGQGPGQATAAPLLREVRVPARAKMAPRRERLTFLFSSIADESAVLELQWENVSVEMPIATDTNGQLQRSIGDLDDIWRSYAAAARFMLEDRKDFDAGLRYADQSLALKDDWYTRWVKAALLAGKRDFQEATREAERAYEIGPSSGGDAFIVLAPELKRNIADWRKQSASAP